MSSPKQGELQRLVAIRPCVHDAAGCPWRKYPKRRAGRQHSRCCASQSRMTHWDQHGCSDRRTRFTARSSAPVWQQPWSLRSAAAGRHGSGQCTVIAICHQSLGDPCRRTRRQRRLRARHRRTILPRVTTPTGLHSVIRRKRRQWSRRIRNLRRRTWLRCFVRPEENSDRM